ncbi:GntR family transcriptional regulator [Burkholderia sp. SCN-KJ]|uniref:GntR family transcriptional regulator n=1 Tax=Burkholderia sp. SCN-KJ TaxID=2969248 RepID=UPI00214F8713|nr:GntR family transcriptional regulator [Burkholderia sp. SCN-KJ]MCR4471728.1 GntR family transcriptional regulator [Burkholderia sp. SCN-KJ]
MESQQERVLVYLRDLILKGEFAPGERLAEVALAERLQASRTPVRLALTTLQQEGLVEPSPAGGYVMRRITATEIADAIAVRGHLEGMAARLVAEHGVQRQLSNGLNECLRTGDRLLAKQELTLDDYAVYTDMNNRFHQLVVEASGNAALIRAIDMNNRLPFASASAMLPMQSALHEGRDWLFMAHRQHHGLVHAMEKGEGTRAQALASEHVQIAQMNLNYALESPELCKKLAPAIHLVADAVL